MTPTICFAATAGVIDAKQGIIRGVSLITEGPALGHGVMVDAKTLEQVKAAAEQYDGGLKVKLDHNSGAGDIVGYIDNLSIDGPKLIGDLHLLENSPHRAYILEIASKIPDTFGLSIAFSGPSEMGSDKTILQRCSEIYSVDIVSEPAANPTGFFSRKMKQYQTAPQPETVTETESPEIETEIELPMNEDTKKAIAGMIESAMMGMADRLSRLESAMPKPADKPVACSSEQDTVQLAANKAAELALKEFAKTIGAPAAPVISAEAPAAKANEAKSFEDLFRAKKDELKGDVTAAMQFCIKNHSTEYVAYRTRVQKGEVIKL